METSVNQRYVAVCGKGGIGKTTVATNLGESLARGLGHKVMLVGTSPKASLIDVYGLNEAMVPILDLKRSQGVTSQNFNKVFSKTANGILITETGGPEPGIGCAGVGIPTAFGELKKYQGQIQDYNTYDFTIYDLIGDIVCGGFSTPFRGGKRQVLIVISGELMAVYAGNNVLRAVNAIGGDLKVLGYVVNKRGVAGEDAVVKAFAERTQVPILATIPRDPKLFKEAERHGAPVVSSLPDSPIAAAFSELARQVDKGVDKLTPKPIEQYEELFDLFMRFQDLGGGTGVASAQDYENKIPAPAKRAKPLKISIYGTGGIGKSTVSANVSAALVLMGEKVFQIGCDPKHDSIANLCGGLKPTILDETQKRGGPRFMNRDILKALVFPGAHHKGMLFGSECGGPVPGKGCGGKGVDLALKLFEDQKLIEEYGFSSVIYDVLGDTVCGGFARPLKYTPQAYIVTNGEIASLTQAMKIAQSIQAAGQRGVDTGIGGIIDNMRGVPNEQAVVEEVFAKVGLPVIHHIPRSELVQRAENMRRTVVELYPDSDQTKHYLELARKIGENKERHHLTREILSNREILEIVNRYS